jgi:hypothetical protein
MRVQNIISVLGVLGFGSALLCGCDPQNTYNSEAAKQNTAETQAKMAELQPAEGDYCGSMYLKQADMYFVVNLTLKAVLDNAHSSSSTDPTDTVQVPKLAGAMTFPAIVNQGSAAYATLPDLMQATGGQVSLSFTYGDYNSVDSTINLPFSVPNGPQGNYGEVTGTLDGNVFSGSWYSESSRLVGTFSLNKCEGASS